MLIALNKRLTIIVNDSFEPIFINLCRISSTWKSQTWKSRVILKHFWSTCIEKWWSDEELSFDPASNCSSIHFSSRSKMFIRRIWRLKDPQKIVCSQFHIVDSNYPVTKRYIWILRSHRISEDHDSWNIIEIRTDRRNFNS